MIDEVTKLRAELDELNLKCQTARDNEVRYALQRSRLETERAQLLVRLMDATSPLGVAPTVAAAPYRIVMQAAAPSKPLTVVTLGERSLTNVVPLPKQRPNGIPTLPEMIVLTLKGAHDGLRSAQIIAQIRREWWPDMPADRLYTTVHRLVQLRRIEKCGDRYRLPVPSGANGAANGVDAAP